MPTESANKHVPVLDGVRGLAALMVVACHLLGPMPEVGLLPTVTHHLIAYGGLGVDVFFVLSGYLITGILLRSRRDAHYYRNFYARRVLRIFPLYYATLLLVLVVAPAVSVLAQRELASTLSHQGWAWLYAVNFFSLFHPGADLPYLGHFWSLAVEEHFYLVWPFVVHALSTRSLGRTCLAVAILSCAARLVAPLAGVDVVSAMGLTPLRLDTLCLGALLAVWNFEDRPRRSIALAAGVVAGAALAIGVCTVLVQRLHPSLDEVARTVRGNASRPLLWAAFAGLLVSGERSLPRRLFSSSGLRFFGRYSYGIYVFHAIMGLAVIHAHGVEALGARLGSVPIAVVSLAAVVTLVSVLLAMLSYRYLESPFLALKASFAPETRAPTKPAARSVFPVPMSVGLSSPERAEVVDTVIR